MEMEIKHRIELVKLLPANSIVAEIGVAEGNFSKDLLDAGVDRLFMVDAWGHIPGVTGDGNFPQEWHDKNYQMAFNKVQPYGWRAKLLRGMSVDMADSVPDNSLDMAYFDAAHFYDGVIADLKAWYPKVKSGGIISGHDFLCKDYQVEQAVIDFIHQYGIVTTVNVIPENNENDASFYFVKP
jgi:hypothetical protein